MGLCTTTLMFEIQTRKQKTLSANQKLRNKLAPGAMEQEAQKGEQTQQSNLHLVLCQYFGRGSVVRSTPLSVHFLLEQQKRGA